MPVPRPALLGRAVRLAAVLVALGAPMAPLHANETVQQPFAGMDLKTRPGDDFYRYVNGGWMDSTEIPADRSRWSIGAETVERIDRQVAELIRQAADGKAEGDIKRVGDFYQAYLDEAAIAAKGLAPVQAAFAQIDAIRDRRALSRVLGSRLRADVDPLNNSVLHTPNPIGLWVAQGLHDPSRYTAYLLQGGLGMPEREYYLSDSPRMQDVRAKYQAYVATLLRLAGFTDADTRAQRVLALERRIAERHVKREEAADVQYADNTWLRTEFARRAPGMDWNAYFDAAGLGRQRDFIVWHPAGIQGVAATVAEAPLDGWKDYLRFHTLDDVAQLLPKDFADAHFAFHRTALTGTLQPLPRWKRAIAATNDALGFAVGRLYAAQHFPASSKAKVQEMVTNIVQAFERRVDQLAWMAPATKAEAKAKLKTLYVGVGYPDTWRDYAGLDIRRDDPAGNVQRAALYETRRAIARLGKPVDRYEWCMAPQIVNAVNLPLQNALNFPAAILQPPFFDPQASDAYNYGAIGSVIGHEISHSFDDQGAQFDAQGRLRNWWTKEDLAHFQQSGASLAAQYSAYKPFPDLAVNGQQTLAENIADLAGLQAAHDALRKALGKPAAAQGDADDQAFFLAYGISWRGKMREPALRRQVLTDGHAPEEFRVQTVRNLDAWYRSFDVAPGQALYLEPGQRVRVW